MVNRYVLEGIVSDLESGAQIAVFIAPYNTVANVLHQITAYTDETYTQVRIAERVIRHDSGGSVTAFTDAPQLRGRSYDVVVVPQGHAADFVGFYIHGAEIIEY